MEFMLKTANDEPAGWVMLKITGSSVVAALPAQMADAKVESSPIPLPDLPTLPTLPTIPVAALDLGGSFGALLSNINGVVEFVDKFAEVKHSNVAPFCPAHPLSRPDPSYRKSSMDDRVDSIQCEYSTGDATEIRLRYSSRFSRHKLNATGKLMGCWEASTRLTLTSKSFKKGGNVFQPQFSVPSHIYKCRNGPELNRVVMELLKSTISCVYFIQEYGNKSFAGRLFKAFQSEHD